MQYNYEELKKLPVFTGFATKKDMDWFFKCMDARRQNYEAGETITTAGETLYFAGVVIDGKAVLEEGGLRTVGDFLFLNYESGKSAPAPTTARAQTPCTVLWLRWMRVTKLCSFDCAFHKSVLERIQLLQTQSPSEEEGQT